MTLNAIHVAAFDLRSIGIGPTTSPTVARRRAVWPLAPSRDRLGAGDRRRRNLGVRHSMVALDATTTHYEPFPRMPAHHNPIRLKALGERGAVVLTTLMCSVRGGFIERDGELPPVCAVMPRPYP